jgi:hypothetical protein
MEADIVHFGNDVPDTRDISHGTPETAANAFDLDFVVFINEVDRTVATCEGSDLPAILDQLDTHALPDCGVRLLCFNTDLFKNDTSRLWSALKRV